MANVPPQGGRKHPEQQYIQMDTTNILFICGGTFVGHRQDHPQAARQADDRLRPGRSGTRSDADMAEAAAAGQRSDDMLEFGMIPELVGRLPVISALTPLDDRRSGSRAHRAEERAGQAVPAAVLDGRTPTCSSPTRPCKPSPSKAQAKETGARGLRSIIEEVMLDIMFDLPEQGHGSRYVITKDVVEGAQAGVPDRGTQKQKRVTFNLPEANASGGSSSRSNQRIARDRHVAVPGFFVFGRRTRKQLTTTTQRHDVRGREWSAGVGD